MVHLVKAMVFPAVLYGCESWPIKKTEYQRTVVLKKTLESLLDSKEIKPVSPKGSQPRIVIERSDAEAEAPILCHLIRRTDSLENSLMLGQMERRRSGPLRMRWLAGIIDSMDMSMSKLKRKWRTGKPGMLQSMRSQKSQTRLSDWTTAKMRWCVWSI